MSTKCLALDAVKVATTPNPYQGLKLIGGGSTQIDTRVATTPNPYQGLKQHRLLCDRGGASGVATTPNPYRGLKRQGKKLWELPGGCVATTPNPYQGLKQNCTPFFGNAFSLQQHQIPIRD